ncbi:hypothetical protein [Phnomibacter ginsenosidimutans]|uniref:Uncharacterized protein n=1 Tax=Phnomibacter ginsenosidimutans TaxID=2676868 RepID=A0A6I6GET6_9BACT|nr:hypothetical protein [Phnomibacter ginsenosidimutans]QGW28910.1 hypothetical protein GLV81_13105 [Phnomibacter ginsenosidimutans]
MFRLIIATSESFHDYAFLSATVDEWVALHSLESGYSGIQVLICPKTDPNGLILRYACRRGYPIKSLRSMQLLLKNANGAAIFWDGKDKVFNRLILQVEKRLVKLLIVFG